MLANGHTAFALARRSSTHRTSLSALEAAGTTASEPMSTGSSDRRNDDRAAHEHRRSSRTLRRSSDVTRAKSIEVREQSQDLLAFLADRLKVHLRDEGIRHDVIDACFQLGGQDDLVLLVARVRALQDFLATEDGANLLDRLQARHQHPRAGGEEGRRRILARPRPALRRDRRPSARSSPPSTPPRRRSPRRSRPRTSPPR